MTKAISCFTARLLSAIIAACFLSGLYGIGAARAEADVPLPEYEITQPLPTDPPEVKELLGIWAGNWEGNLDAVLVITAIDVTEKRAKIIYAYGDCSAWYIKKGYIQVVAEFVPGEKPIIKWGPGTNQVRFDFVLKKGKLKGSRVSGSYWNSVTMTKRP